MTMGVRRAGRTRTTSGNSSNRYMIEGAKQATVVGLAILGLLHVFAARESVGLPILIASAVLWWTWLVEDKR